MKFNRDDFNFFYRYCIALTKDESLAYDLLQTTIEKWIRKDLHSKVTHPKQYFLRMVKNQFLDDLKKDSSLSFQENIEDNIVPEIGNDPLSNILITREELHHALKSMSSSERELIFLWGLEGYTTDEIATHLDLPRGTVLARLFRLKKRVQDTFSKQGKREGL